MKPILRLTVLASFLLLLSPRGHGQELIERINSLKSMKYFDWVKTFHDFYSEKQALGKTDRSGTGFKQVSRLLNYYRTRLDQDGNIVNTDVYNWKAYKDFVHNNQAQPFASVSPQTASWNYGGPFNVRGLDNKVSGIGRIAFIKLDPNDAGNASQAVIFVGTPKGGLWKGIFNKTTGLVPSWTNITDGLPNIGASDLCIHPSNRNIMYLVSGDKEAGVGTAPSGIGILKTTDGGATWLPTAYFDDTPPTFSYGNIRKLVMDYSNPSRMWAVTTTGIIRTTDGWQTFTEVLNGNFWDLEKGRNTSNQNLIACTSSRVYTTNDYGTTWTTVKQNSPNQALDYSFSSNRAQICVSESFSSDRSFFLWYVTGDFNTTTSNIKLYSGAASTWSDKYSGTNLVHVYQNYCMAFEGNPANTNVYAGGVTLKQSQDAGATWTDLNQGVGAAEFSSGIHADQHFMAWDQGYLFLGNDGGVYNYNNASGGWRYLSDGMYITQYYRLAYNNNANGFQVLCGAQDNGTHRSSEHVGCCDGMEALINYNTPTTVYASYQGANVIRSTNSGDTWANFFPSGFQNDNVWITPMAMHKTNPAYIALGELSGSTGAIDIYNGSSWSQKATTSGEFVWLAFAKSAPNVMYGITDSKIVKISDVTAASPTISTFNLPTSGATSVTVDPGNSAHVFYTAGGYSATSKVYESTNSGSSWTNITLNLPNTPVNCILMNDAANDDLYVGTDIGVFVKLPGWTYWAPFMNGLPNTQVNDLDIGNGLLTCATYGRGRWYTNLYGSCVADLDLTPANDPSNGITTSDQYYTASDTISSTRVIEGGIGSNVTYRAGNSVTLKQGFHAKVNNEFLGMIGPCFPGGPAPLGGLFDSSYIKMEKQTIRVPSPGYNYMKPPGF